MTAIDDQVITKVCSKCTLEKPLTDFYKNPNMANGRASWCKKCQNDQKRSKYHNDKLNVIQQTRAQRFIAGVVDPSELTHEELINGFIYLDDGTKYSNKNFDSRTKNKFAAELSKRLNTMIRDKAQRSLEVIFDIFDSDLVEPADRFKAASWWAERVIGKTPEKLEVTLEGAPYEEIFENLNGGSREAHRKALGQAIDAEVIDDIDEQENLVLDAEEVAIEDPELVVENVQLEDGSLGAGLGGDVSSGNQSGLVGDKNRLGDELSVSRGISESTEAVADKIVDKAEEAKALKKRIAAAKKKRFAARAVGASSLALAPWLIDWRVHEDGLQACLVPPALLTPARLDIIRANAAATDDLGFIAVQRANMAVAKAERARTRLDALRRKANG